MACSTVQCVVCDEEIPVRQVKRMHDHRGAGDPVCSPTCAREWIRAHQRTLCGRIAALDLDRH